MLILSATFALATYKLGTTVVEVTVSGAVPVATFETSVLAVTAPLTPNDVSVPTLVICVCEALTLNVVPVNVKPVPAVYVPAPENCVNTIFEVPIVGLSVVCTQPVSACVLPDVTKKKSPPAASALVSKSVDLVKTVVLV